MRLKSDPAVTRGTGTTDRFVTSGDSNVSVFQYEGLLDSKCLVLATVARRGPASSAGQEEKGRRALGGDPKESGRPPR